jgi:putative membrane protein
MIGAAIGSAIHILSAILGFFFMALRTQRLGGSLDGKLLDRMLFADNIAGLTAIGLIGSGLTRLLYLEKSREFYYRNGFFYMKLGIFGVIMLLELVPMTAFIIWRVDQKKGKVPDTSKAPLYHRIGQVQIALLIPIVFCAAMMARGLWLF